MHAYIAGIEYVLPEKVIDTISLALLFPSWSVEKIDAKTGIHSRHIVSTDQCASDLAVEAASKLFNSGVCSPHEIDFLIVCTQSPDYVLPSTACLLQHRLGISTRAGCLDINLGCSGFVYGLGLCEGLITSGQARSILLITADTYSKYLEPTDKASRTIFGDGSAATLIRAREKASLGPFIYGTDGSGAKDLIVEDSGTRRRTAQKCDTSSLQEEGHRVLLMNGSSVFSFAIKRVPSAVEELLRVASIPMEQVDLFVFHQANAYLLEELRSILSIPRDKFQITLEHCANTVSSTIPIALKHAQIDGKLDLGAKIVLVGFGVGYSWSATLMRWAG